MTALPLDEDGVIAELASDELGEQRRRALLSRLREVGTERCVSVLGQNLRSDDPQSQTRAALALGRIGTDAAADALIEALDLDTGPRFTFALKILGDAHAHQARAAFIRVLEERGLELRQGDKRLLIRALARSPHRSAIPALAGVLGDPSRRTRRMASEALAQIKSPESAAALRQAADTVRWPRSREAKKALRSVTEAGDG